MKNRIFFFLMTLFSVLNCSAYSVFVGNGGEGYEVNGELYTRDLYDYDLHKTPWIGPNSDPLIETALARWNPLQLTENELKLLSRKLTDLNVISSNLGDDVLLVLEYFQWSFSEQPLVLIDPDEIRRPVDNNMRVSIANRFLNSIVISKEQFHRLNADNKIALLLHEAFYSLTSVKRGVSLEGVQSLSSTRMTVAVAFNKNLIDQASTAELLKSQLRIVPSKHPSSRKLTGPHFKISIFAPRPAGGFLELISSAKLLLENPEVLDDLCGRFFKKYDSVYAAQIEPVAERKVYSSLYLYKNSEQYALSIGEPYPEPKFISLQARDLGACTQGLRNAINPPR